jgi:hypothetical protein
MAIDLNDLGMTKEELQEKVIDRICAQVLESTSFDDDGEERSRPSSFHGKLIALVKKTVDEKIDQIAQASVLPNVAAFIDKLTLQETTKWGEKRGEPVTFVEYLVSRAEAYMTEEVDYHGKTRAEDSYNWRKHTTRLSHLIHEHLQFNINKAMTEACGTANKSIRSALEGAVKMALDTIKVSVETKVTDR